MKRYVKFLLIGLLAVLILTACGSSGGGDDTTPAPSEVTLVGRIVNQDGIGLGNVNVDIGNYNVDTDSSGNFQIENFETGKYQISGRGGTGDDLYMFGPRTVDISEEILSITAYKLNGFGVIAEPYSGPVESMSGKTSNVHIVNSYKKISWEDFKRNDSYSESSVSGTNASYRGFVADVSPDFFKNNMSFFALLWEQVNNAEKYQIKYDGEVIWDSDINPEKYGEYYSSSEPQAYLDLGPEVPYEDEDRNFTAGEYDFQLIYINNNDESVIMATISLSIGQYLSDHPTNLTKTDGQDELTWTGVDEVHIYRVGIYTEKEYTTDNCQWGPTEVGPDSSSVEFDGTSLNDPNDNHYHFIVDAIYYDEDGYPLELTRNNSGFIYQ